MSSTLRNVLIKYGVDISQYTTQTSKLKSEQTKIENAFRQTANSMEDWESTSVGLSARVSSLSEKIKLQKDVLTNLRNQYDAVSAAAGDDSEASAKLQREYNKASTQLDKMNKELSDYREKLYNAATAEGKTGKEAQEMGGQLKKAETDTKSFKGSLKEFATSSVGSFMSVTAIVGTATQAFKALWDMISESAKAAKEIYNLHQTTGMAIESYQEWDYILKKTGYSMEQASGDFAALGEKAMDASMGVGEGAELFGKLGINVEDTGGKLKSQEQIFEEVVSSLQNMNDVTERNAIASALMSTTGEQLASVLNMTGGEVDDLKKEANELGIVVGTGNVAALNKLQGKLEDTAAVMEAEGMKMAASLAPVTDWLAGAWQEVVRFTSVTETMNRHMMTFGGLTREQATEFTAMVGAYQNAQYVMGYSEEQMTAEIIELSKVLIHQGVPASDLMAESLGILAQGMDDAAYKTKVAEDAQASFDSAITTALENYKTKNAEYLAEIKSTADGYISSMGSIFDEFKINTEVTGETLLQNLKTKEAGIAEWATNIDALAKRNIDQGLLDSLRKMGPAAAGEIAALNSLSDPKLKEYVTSWKNMSDTATAEAEKANADMKYNVLKSLDELKYAIDDKEAGMEQVAKALGLGITDGMIDGLDSSKVNNKIARMAREALATAKRELEQHSPSRKFMEIGKNVSLGMAIGIEDKTPDVLKEMSTMSSGMIDTFSGIDLSIPKISALPYTGLTPSTTSTTNIKNGGNTVNVYFEKPPANDYDVEKLATTLGYYLNGKKLANGG